MSFYKTKKLARMAWYKTLVRRIIGVLIGLYTLFFVLSILDSVGLTSYSIPGLASTSKQGPSPSLVISNVDTSEFPIVRVHVHGQNLGVSLDTIPLSLQEDGTAQELLVDELAPIGVQVALVSNLPRRTTRDESYRAAAATAKHLVQSGLFSPNTDWFAAFVTADYDQLSQIQAWTQDQGSVAEALARHRPPDGVQNMALFDMLGAALDHFDQVAVPADLRKVMVVLSDGRDDRSARTLTDVTDKAAKKSITIYTILVGSSNGQGSENLERLAVLSGGRYVVPESVEDLTPVWQLMALGRNQRVLGYRSGRAHPRQVKVTASLPNGQHLQIERRFPSLNLQPVEIRLSEVVSDTLIVERHAAKYNTPLEKRIPTTYNVQPSLVWTDGYTRSLTSVQVDVDGIETVQQKLPFDRISLPIDQLDDGEYLLQLTVTDEFGIVSKSVPTLLVIHSIFPSTARYWAMAKWGGGVLLLATLVAGGYFMHKKSRPINAAQSEAVPTGAVLSRKSRRRDLPGTIALYSGINRIGRSRKRNTIVIQDPTVSGTHCRIVQVAQGYFRVLDAGSKNGTFVNDQAVDQTNGKVLNAGDEVRLGPSVVYVFGFSHGPNLDESIAAVVDRTEDIIV